MHTLRISAFLIALLVASGPARAVDYFVCDCGTDADPDCLPGNDVAAGDSASDPWRTYDRARSEWSSLQPGDAIRFCRGGAFEIEGGSRWNNSQCLAGNPCVVSDYDAPWATGDEGRPILWQNGDGHAFSLEDGGDADHEEGYLFQNLELRCTVCDQTGGWGFFIYNDVDDVVIEGFVIDSFAIGVHLASSNPCSTDPACNGLNERITLRYSVIVGSHAQGWLGSGDESVIAFNYFENNGTEAIFDHNIYYSGSQEPTFGSRIIGNELYRSALDAQGSCAAVSLVSHGVHSDLLIEGNLVREDVGFANPGCWGIAVDPGYGSSEAFTNIVIRGNTVRNVGNVSIGTASCTDCVIENNVIVHEQDFGVSAIAAPDRDRGGEDSPMTRVTVRNNSIYVGAGGGRGIVLGGEGDGHVLVSNAIQYTGTGGNWSCLETDLPTASYDANDNNLCDDPGFTAPAGPDFDLTPSGPNVAMVGAGHASLSSPTDYWGNPRDTAPDIGAYEHGQSPPATDAGVPAWDGSIFRDGGPGNGSGNSGCGCTGPGADPGLPAGPLFFLMVFVALTGCRARAGSCARRRGRS